MGKGLRLLGCSSQTQLMGTEHPTGVPILQGLGSKCYGPQIFLGLEFWMQSKSHQCDVLLWNSECLSKSETLASCCCRCCLTQRQRSFQIQHSVWCSSVTGDSGSAAAHFQTAASKVCPDPLSSPASHTPPTWAPNFRIKHFPGETPRVVPGPCIGIWLIYA